MAGGEPIDVVQPHQHAHVLGVTAQRHPRRRGAPRSRPPRTPPRCGGRCRSRSGPRSSCAPPTCSPARGGTRSTRPPCSASPRPPIQAEIDAACELIDFLRFNVHFAQPAAGRAAEVLARGVEPVRPPPAGGLRLRDHPVQLHRDRRQPALRAGAAGQHRGLEAVADPAVRRALHHAAVRGGRPAARRDQHGHRATAQAVSEVALADPDLAGIHFTGSTRSFQHLWRTVGENLAALPVATRAWSARPAARTSWSRTPAPTWTRCTPR